ncbi:MAG: hypothetical protein R8N23_03125 [Reichenbachiella sp.]|uniref:hypothetical protein n=1 Tax=Reichenbachiella sp. TaxID=2184521 RepID=UPI0029664BFE|nr:hypothetical protein [Reichenbachiella sp.]MDW3208830.1 hypothetical protein [Reichenbachiella sp.]
MKKITVLQFILLLSLNAYAQSELKKKSKSTDFLAESFFVLKSKKSVKEGEYELKIKDGHMIKESVLVRGQYENSKPVGKWDYYNAFGELNYSLNASTNEITDFSAIHSDIIVWSYSEASNPNFRGIVARGGKIIPSRDYYEKEYDITAENEILQSQLDQPPLLKGSPLVYQLELMEILNECTNTFNSVSMSVIRFIIDENGHERDYQVQVYSNQRFEDKYIQILKEKNHKWIPGKLNGNNVSVEMTIPILIMPGSSQDPDYRNYYITFSNPDAIVYSQNLKKDEYKHIAGWLFKSL